MKVKMTLAEKSEVVIVGGGFYGCCIALYLRRFFSKIIVIEKEHDLMQRASYINQARVHMGYHYPRNLVTAYRSLVNFPRFINDFRKSIIHNFVKLYAIANKGSKVNAFRFYNMFKKMGAPIQEAPEKYKALFNDDLIENVFLVKEYAFDATQLKGILRQRLESSDVDILLDSEVGKIGFNADETFTVEVNGGENIINSEYIFICAYSNINKILSHLELPLLPLKHEITEICLVDIAEQLQNLGITVMDGPFFSTMPFPSQGLHSLTHVRYTPHCSWSDQIEMQDGEKLLSKIKKLESNFLHMQKDSQRFIPLLKDACYQRSLFEIKTVLVNNEIDDGRPILFKKDYAGKKNLYIVLGGKIDNIYDIVEMIEMNKKELGLKEKYSKRFIY